QRVAMWTQGSIPLPGARQQYLARLDVVYVVRQHQPVHALQACPRIEALAQGTALSQQLGVAMTAILADPLFDQVPGMLHRSALEQQAVLPPEMPQHFPPVQFDLAAR